MSSSKLETEIKKDEIISLVNSNRSPIVPNQVNSQREYNSSGIPNAAVQTKVYLKKKKKKKKLSQGNNMSYLIQRFDLL